ncbi:uncharacterized protein LY89DRAFT_267533 [Mollisia scopiformis]|uniref:Zn(2)-C6 fungal-type domain-containing protein n=1 Tax=Mollisia scopiformis TaxID=149040 RepID=A0A132BDR6_MOLSC|nr:uncharacterized protein LY89DRAFT_267533 [Mollisia scopiformis]KUJ09974.1 hypothetical protein LY89DRAFT_267533 [Mollisia scopiformis]
MYTFAQRLGTDRSIIRCKRCQTFGVHCDGYDIVVSSKKPRPKDLRPLVPMARTETKASTRAKIRNPVNVYRQPGSPRFENENEARYFNCFHVQIAHSLSRCFDPEIWPRSFLMASEAVWPIRKGLIALGALDLTSKEALSQIREGPTKEGITDNYLFALQEYTRFIRGMKQVMAPEDLRTQLLASIIIICFESYLGDPKAVEFQVRTCIKLLDQWKKKHQKPWHHPLKSPAPNMVEDELLHLFERLDLEVISQNAARDFSREEHLRLKDEGIEAIANMPEAFSGIDEARMYGNLLHRRTVHFANAYDDKTAPHISVWERVSASATPAVLDDFETQRKAWYRWGQAFDPLFKHSLTPEGASTFFIMSVLRAHYLVLQLLFESVFQKDEVFYDYFHNDFVEMLALCKGLLANESSKFVLSAHTIVVLDLVAKKCRDPEVRREAIKLLGEKPRREAFWDSVMAAKICAWIMEVEEEGMVNGFIPEESRARKIGAEFNLPKKEAKIWCYQLKEQGSSMELRKRETTITWGTPLGSMPFYSGGNFGEKWEDCAADKSPSLFQLSPTGRSLVRPF